MEKVFQIFKTYPFSIASYSVYSFLYYFVITADIRYRAALPHINGGERLSWGEGVMYGYLFITLDAVIFALVTMGCIIAYKKHIRFYVCLLAMIIIPVIIANRH